jgi:hypothetical protein
MFMRKSKNRFPCRKQLVRSLRDAFRVEPLEPRVLLSADPVMGAVHAILPDDRDQDQFGAYDILAQQDSFDDAQPFRIEHA